MHEAQKSCVLCTQGEHATLLRHDVSILPLLAGPDLPETKAGDGRAGPYHFTSSQYDNNRSPNNDGDVEWRWLKRISVADDLLSYDADDISNYLTTERQRD